MKATLSALALTGLTTLLSACATAPVHPSSPQLAPRHAQMQRFAAGRSDEGLRKGVIALRKQRFQKWDKNFDAVITRNEVRDEDMRLPGVIEGFHSYDVNGDGEITLQEFLRDDVIEFWMNLLRPKLEEQFARLDRDGNRLLTGSEQDKLKLFLSMWPELKGGDANGDGVVTFSEYEDAYMAVLPFFQQRADGAQLPSVGPSAPPALSGQSVGAHSFEGVRRGVEAMRTAKFRKYDANGDGALTLGEVSDRNLMIPGLIDGFNDYDANRDGQIELQEFLLDRVIYFWMDLYIDITENEFYVLDHNGDRFLTGTEKHATDRLFERWPQFNGGDRDGDGRVSFDEYQDSYMEVAPYMP